MEFKNRTEAGKALVEKLGLLQPENVIVYALPRGGVPVAKEIADHFQAPLELVVTRKIFHPYNENYPIGALAEDDEPFLVTKPDLHLNAFWLENEVSARRNDIKRRRYHYFKNLPPLSATGKTVVLVDDGIKTGYTMNAAIRYLKKQQPARIIVAIPVIPESLAQKLETQADEVVAVERTTRYQGTPRAYYQDFHTVLIEEVAHLVGENRHKHTADHGNS